MYCSQVVLVVYILIAFRKNPHVNAGDIIAEDSTQFSRLLQKNYLVILDEKNLTSSVYNSDKSWVVGYLARNEALSMDFMKLLKDVAYALRILSDVSVAAISCARENTPENACTKQNVTSNPTIKYYPPHAKDDSPGIQMETVNILEDLAHNIFRLMNKFENPGIEDTHPNIGQLIWTDNNDQNGGTKDSSGKKTAWQSASLYIIYVCIGWLALIIILWSSYSIFKRFSRREMNVYSVLHKSETNDEDSIQVRLKN